MQQINDSIEQKSICRLCCYETTDEMTDIYAPGEAPDPNFNYSMKIQKYLYLKVSADDNFPKTVCWMCTQNLDTFHRFYKKINEIQQKIYKDLYVTFALNVNYIKLDKSDISEERKNPPLNTLILTYSGPSTESRCLDNEFNYPLNLDEQDPATVEETPENPENIGPLMVKRKRGRPKRVKDLTINSSSTSTTKLLTRSKLKEMNRIITRTSSQSIDNTETFETVVDPKVPIQESIDICIVGHEDEMTETPTNNSAEKDEIEEELVLPVARDSDDDDWPAKSTLDKFPKEIIRDGVLLIRGKKLMAMISNFYNLECRFCEKNDRQVYRNLTDLLNHSRAVHNENGYVECCQKKMFRYPAIVMHMARHLQPSAFRCEICGYIVTRPRFLEPHIQTHLPEDEKPYGCDQCSRRFCWKGALQIHQISHLPQEERRKYICYICGKSYETPGGLSTHKQLAHSNREKSVNVCHVCAKKFATKTGLNEHMQTIHRPREVGQLQCAECGKWYMNKRCLKSHMILHSNVLHKCEVCDYTTKKPLLLKRHLLTQHSNEKPFSCDQCGKKFKLKRALTVHVKSHSDSTLHKCTFCPRVFNSSTNFYTHRKNHHPDQLKHLKNDKLVQQRLKRIQAGIEYLPDNLESDQFSDRDGCTISITTGVNESESIQESVVDTTDDDLMVSDRNPLYYINFDNDQIEVLRE